MTARILQLAGHRRHELEAEQLVHEHGEALAFVTRHLGGAEDLLVPPDYLEAFVARARTAGDDVHLTVLPRSGHFDLVVPAGADLIAGELAALLG